MSESPSSRLSNIPSCAYTTCSSSVVDGHLCCSHFLTLVNDAALSAWRQVPAFRFLGCVPRLDLLAHTVNLCLTFSGGIVLFSIADFCCSPASPYLTLGGGSDSIRGCGVGRREEAGGPDRRGAGGWEDKGASPEPSLPMTSLLSFPPPPSLQSFPFIHFLVGWGRGRAICEPRQGVP